MAIYSRIKTTPIEIVVVRNGVTRTILRSSMPTRPTATQVLNVIRVAFGVGNVNDLFVHINRNDSIALATGQEPMVWPEDDVEQ